MKKDAKPLKAFSIEEIENAIATAISSLTNTEVQANLVLFKKSDFDPLVLTSGKEQFELSLTLKVGVSYTYGLEKNEDGSFKL